METQDRAEREINLTQLFWNILLGWRQIICLGIVFAVLLSGLKYYMDGRSYKISQNVNIEETKDGLKEEELEKLADAEEMQIRIDDYEKYMDKSPLMQINPYEKPVVELQYYVKSDYVINYTKDSNRDYTDEVTSLYCNYIAGGDMAQKVIEKVGLSVNKEDFRELMQVTQNSGTINISFSYVDTAKLQEVSDTVKFLLEQKTAELQEIGSHTLELVNESQNVVVDSTLIDRKATMASSISTLKSQLQTLKSGMSSTQLAVFDAEMEELRGEPKEEEQAPGFSLKFVILGAFVGMFLASAWIVCRMLFSARLQDAEEIRTMFGIRLLGEVSVSSDKKRFLSFVDKKLLAIKNRRKKSLSVEKQISIASTNIVLSCRQQGIECIYMTGSDYEKIDSAVLDKVKKELSSQKIKVKEGENIFYDAASMQAGIETGTILFVEQKGQSIYDEIYNEINLVREQKGNILGAVVLG